MHLYEYDTFAMHTGYQLNYCPAQNFRFSHINPKTDLDEEKMWKTVLLSYVKTYPHQSCNADLQRLEDL